MTSIANLWDTPYKDKNLIKVINELVEFIDEEEGLNKEVVDTSIRAKAQDTNSNYIYEYISNLISSNIRFQENFTQEQLIEFIGFIFPILGQLKGSRIGLVFLFNSLGLVTQFNTTNPSLVNVIFYEKWNSDKIYLNKLLKQYNTFYNYEDGEYQSYQPEQTDNYKLPYYFDLGGATSFFNEVDLKIDEVGVRVTVNNNRNILTNSTFYLHLPETRGGLYPSATNFHRFLSNFIHPVVKLISDIALASSFEGDMILNSTVLTHGTIDV